MDRRSFFQVGASGLAALWLSDTLSGRARADEAKPAAAGPPARAKACIVLYLNGGPSHVDTFDPKPGTKDGGPFRAIATRAAGVQISEHLPRLAERMHEVALLRGMSSKEGNHERARFLTHTGYSPNPTVAHPGLGGWVAHARGDARADLPAFVSIAGPSEGGGFLGSAHDPLVVLAPGAPPTTSASTSAALRSTTSRTASRARRATRRSRRAAPSSGRPCTSSGRRALPRSIRRPSQRRRAARTAIRTSGEGVSSRGASSRPA